MKIEKKLFGKTKDGEDVFKFELENDNHMKVVLSEAGAAIISICLSDKNGDEKDVILGLNECDHYFKNWPGFGAIIGRCANRISKASFMLDGKRYKLKRNIKGGCIHSGFSYQYRKWSSEHYKHDGCHVIFSLTSPDGDQGFPGTLSVSVEYVLTNDNKLHLIYRGVSDKNTFFNLTNHSYFNLNGHESGTIFEHYVQINSNKVTQLDKNQMPTGTILDVKGSPFDFLECKPIAQNVSEDLQPYTFDKEFDINYVLDCKFGNYKKVASLFSNQSGIGLNVYTDMPGMQFYTGNAIEGIKGKNDVMYHKNDGVCFETQFFPDAVNIHEFPSPEIKAFEEFKSETTYEFFVDDKKSSD